MKLSKLKTALSLVLTIALLAGTLCGCQPAQEDSTVPSGTPEPTVPTWPTGEKGSTQGTGSSNAATVYDPFSTDNLLVELPEALRQDILSYYGLTGTSSERHAFSLHYYGTYHDYVVLFVIPSAVFPVVSSLSIGGNVFTSANAPVILDAYKDGQIQSLKDVYESGSITDHDLEQIHQCHLQLFPDLSEYFTP